MNTTTFNRNICNIPALYVYGSSVVSIAAAIIIDIIDVIDVIIININSTIIITPPGTV